MVGGLSVKLINGKFAELNSIPAKKLGLTSFETDLLISGSNILVFKKVIYQQVSDSSFMEYEQEGILDKDILVRVLHYRQVSN